MLRGGNHSTESKGASTHSNGAAPETVPGARAALHGAPFLKWAGGKQWLAPALVAAVRDGRGGYFEPFLGGGAVFFAARPSRAVLSDKNPELIAAYRAVQTSPAYLIRRLRALTFSRTRYYRMREEVPRGRIQRAARLVYLNRTCWNGLYRVNQEGRFNVPVGRFTYSPDFIGVERIRAAHEALKGATLRACDFEVAVSIARRGDTVYFDPPYTAAHLENGFLRYNEHIFSWADQERLAAVALRLTRRGCRVLVSNAPHPAILGLYRSFRVTRIRRTSLIAGSPGYRRNVSEIVLSNFPVKF